MEKQRIGQEARVENVLICFKCQDPRIDLLSPPTTFFPLKENNSAEIMMMSNVVAYIDVFFLHLGEKIPDSSVTGNAKPEFGSFPKERRNG